MITYINECDKLKITLPREYVKGYVDFCAYAPFTGGVCRLVQDKIVIELSGKIFSTPTDLGSITKENIEQIPEIIKERTGMEIDIGYFMEHATLCRFDIKKDLLLTDKPSVYLSEMRESLNRNTDKYTIHRYGALNYEEGLTLIPKAKSTKHRYSMYDKGTEVKKNRYKNSEYYDKFVCVFLDDISRTVRCEYQSLSFDDMRKVLKLPKNKKPAVADIFEYRPDIIEEQYRKLLAA